MFGTSVHFTFIAQHCADSFIQYLAQLKELKSEYMQLTLLTTQEYLYISQVDGRTSIWHLENND